PIEDFDLAISLLDPALSTISADTHGPQYFHLKALLGKAQFGKGDDEAAIANLKEVIDQTPNCLTKAHPAYRLALFTLALVPEAYGRKRFARDLIEQLIPIALGVGESDDGGPHLLAVVEVGSSIYESLEEWPDAYRCESIAWSIRKDI